jgi:predicted phage tail protein
MGKAAGAILAIGAIVISGGLVAAGGALFGAAGSLSAAIGIAGSGAVIIQSVVAMGIQMLGSKLLGMDKPSGIASTAASPILANEASSVASLPIVYGRRLVGAKRIYLNVNEENEYLHMVVALSEGEIGRIRKVFFNDELAVDFTSNTATQTGSVPGGESIDPGSPTIIEKFRDNLRMRYRLGTPTQTSIDYLSNPSTGKFPTDWTVNARCKGVAIAYFELKFDRDVYQQIPSITVEIDGIEIRRTDDLATRYSVFTNPSHPDSFGANPADVLYDYLTNQIYGKAIAANQIDIASFVTARAYCEETITETFGTTTDSFSRYLINGHVSPDATLYDNVKVILSSFNGYLVYSNGQYRLLVMRPRFGTQAIDANLYQFGEDNMIGPSDLQLGNKQSRFNRVKMTYFDREQRYTPNMVYYSNNTYLARDNNQVLEREVELNMVTDQRQANYISALILNQSRYTGMLNWTAPYTALQIEVGDVVAMTIPNLGFVAKQFRIMSVSINQDSTLDFSATEYDDSIYTVGTLTELALPGTVTVPADSSLFEQVVTPPSALTATARRVQNADGSTSSMIEVTFVGVPQAAYYEVDIAGPVSSIYTTIGTPITIGPVPNGNYVVGIRSVNSMGNKSARIT